MKPPTTSFDPRNPAVIYEGSSQFVLGTCSGKTINYEFPKMLRYLEVKGKLLFGKNFRIYEDDHELLLKLTSYFVQDHQYCSNLGIDTTKGILLSGPVGCGKTTLMKLLPHLVPHLKTYTLIPSRNIVFGFNAIGYKMIEDYADTQSYCFDDLGVEHIGRHYGKDCNVMGEILLSRYDLFCLPSSSSGSKNKAVLQVQPRSLTHATTNLNADELETRYGNRVRSRMRQMFNLVAFDVQSKDKRS